MSLINTATSVDLTKGGKIDLTKNNPGLKNLKIGLGWDIKPGQANDFDLDVSAILLNAEAKSLSPHDFVFYNRAESANGAVKHSGDNRTGAGDGDDEVVTVDLSKVPAECAKIEFNITIHEAAERRQNFGQVNNAYARVIDADTNNQLARCDLSEDHSMATNLLICRLYRHNGEWKFEAVEEGAQKDLAAVIAVYGL